MLKKTLTEVQLAGPSPRATQTRGLWACWFGTKVLACQSFGYLNVGQKTCPHFGRENVRGGQILTPNQIVGGLNVRLLNLGQPGGPRISVGSPPTSSPSSSSGLANLAPARGIPEPRETGSSVRLRSGAPKSIPIARSTATAMEAHHASRGRRTVRFLLARFLRRDGAQIRAPASTCF